MSPPIYLANNDNGIVRAETTTTTTTTTTSSTTNNILNSNVNTMTTSVKSLSSLNKQQQQHNSSIIKHKKKEKSNKEKQQQQQQQQQQQLYNNNNNNNNSNRGAIVSPSPSPSSSSSSSSCDNDNMSLSTTTPSSSEGEELGESQSQSQSQSPILLSRCIIQQQQQQSCNNNNNDKNNIENKQPIEQQQQQHENHEHNNNNNNNNNNNIKKHDYQNQNQNNNNMNIRNMNMNMNMNINIKKKNNKKLMSKVYGHLPALNPYIGIFHYAPISGKYSTAFFENIIIPMDLLNRKRKIKTNPYAGNFHGIPGHYNKLHGLKRFRRVKNFTFSNEYRSKIKHSLKEFDAKVKYFKTQQSSISAFDRTLYTSSPSSHSSSSHHGRNNNNNNKTKKKNVNASSSLSQSQSLHHNHQHKNKQGDSSCSSNSINNNNNGNNNNNEQQHQKKRYRYGGAVDTERKYGKSYDDCALNYLRRITTPKRDIRLRRNSSFNSLELLNKMGLSNSNNDLNHSNNNNANNSNQNNNNNNDNDHNDNNNYNYNHDHHRHSSISSSSKHNPHYFNSSMHHNYDEFMSAPGCSSSAANGSNVFNISSELPPSPNLSISTIATSIKNSQQQYINNNINHHHHHNHNNNNNNNNKGYRHYFSSSSSQLNPNNHGGGSSSSRKSSIDHHHHSHSSNNPYHSNSSSNTNSRKNSISQQQQYYQNQYNDSENDSDNDQVNHHHNQNQQGVYYTINNNNNNTNSANMIPINNNNNNNTSSSLQILIDDRNGSPPTPPQSSESFVDDDGVFHHHHHYHHNNNTFKIPGHLRNAFTTTTKNATSYVMEDLLSDANELKNVGQWQSLTSNAQHLHNIREKQLEHDIILRTTRCPMLIQDNVIAEKYDLYTGMSLGEGSFAKVYPGQHKKTQQPVAIKSVIKKYLLTDEDKALITNEIENLTKVNHRHIVHLYETFESEEYLYLVTERCTSGDFSNILQIRRFVTDMEAKWIMKQLLEAIEHSHDCGVVHCDIKPENMLFSTFVEDNGPRKTIRRSSALRLMMKLCDFGLSRKVPDVRYYKFTKDIHKIPFSRKMGTGGYMAPEIHAEEPFGKPADIWSAGVVLYRALCGTMPFMPAQKCVTDKVKFTGRLWEKTPDVAKELISEMLARNPKARITASEALQHPWFETVRECSPTLLRSTKDFNDK